MANLNEYLGAIVAHLSQARVLADLESAKIALTYADNDLLRHFSIPRMRIDDVELTIPVAVSELEIAAVRDPKPLDKNVIAALTHTEILTSFGPRSLPAEASDALRADITPQVETLVSQINRNNAEDLARDYASNVVRIVEKRISSLLETRVIKDQDVQKWREASDRFKETLSGKVKSELAIGAVNSSLGNLKVVVESDKLKEKNPNTLMVIKMKLSEEAMEWERMKDDQENIISKLMPA